MLRYARRRSPFLGHLQSPNPAALDEERARALALRSDGFTLEEIAQRLGRNSRQPPISSRSLSPTASADRRRRNSIAVEPARQPNPQHPERGSASRSTARKLAFSGRYKSPSFVTPWFFGQISMEWGGGMNRLAGAALDRRTYAPLLESPDFSGFFWGLAWGAFSGREVVGVSVEQPGEVDPVYFGGGERAGFVVHGRSIVLWWANR